MREPLVKGHPLHAIATDLVVGGVTLGAVCDVASLVLADGPWRSTADLALAFALVSGILAAALGLWDYQAVPREHPARRVGAWHGWINAAALALLAGSLMLRWLATSDSRLVAIGLSVAAFAVFSVGGWLGGDLVFRLGWRVVPAEHAEQLEADLRETGESARVDRAHRRVEQHERDHALVP